MFWKREQTLLEKSIDEAIHDLMSRQPGTEEFAKASERLVALSQAKAGDKASRLSKDTLAVVAGNLLGILMIIKHEHVNVVASKAMQLLLSPRIKA